MYKDKNGLYREAVIINGKRKVFSAKKKSELLLKIAKFDIQKKEALKFHSIAEDWREEHWEELTFGSKRSYNPCYQRAIERFGDRDIDSITPKDIQFWLKELGKQYALKTVQNHKGVVSQIFDHAIINLTCTYRIHVIGSSPLLPLKSALETHFSKMKLKLLLQLLKTSFS